MEQLAAEGILSHFTAIDDPREARAKRHLRVDIVCIAILAVICDANGYEEIEGYGLAEQEGLSSCLKLPHAIPSAATFRRGLAAINPAAWQACCLTRVRSLALEDDETAEEVLAAAGPTARGSREGEPGALPTVSVWASQQGIVIGRAQVAAHSNERTALPELIEGLDGAGAVLTTDAVGTHKSPGRLESSLHTACRHAKRSIPNFKRGCGGSRLLSVMIMTVPMLTTRPWTRHMGVKHTVGRGYSTTYPSSTLKN